MEGTEPEGLYPPARTEPRLTGHSGQRTAQLPIAGVKPLLPAEKKRDKKEIRRAGTAPWRVSAPGAQRGLFQGHAALGRSPAAPKITPGRVFRTRLPKICREGAFRPQAGLEAVAEAALLPGLPLPVTSSLSTGDTHLRRVRLSANGQETPSFPAAGKGSCGGEKRGSPGIDRLLANQRWPG